MRRLLLMVEAAGLLSILTAATLCDTAYVQSEVIKTELTSEVTRARIDVLSKNTNGMCLVLGILGAVQLGIGMIGLRRTEKKPPNNAQDQRPMANLLRLA